LPSAPPDEEQGQAEANKRPRSTTAVQQKRQEQEIAHPCRRIERADGEEQTEAAATSSLCCGFILDWRDEGLPGHERQQRDSHRQPDEGHHSDDRPPGDDSQQDRDHGRKRSLPEVASEIIDAERPA
jgi:hypothetical protein